jgi:hypothetical protein
VDFAYTGYSRARGKDRERQDTKERQNAQQPRWIEVGREQCKVRPEKGRKMKMYIIPKYTPAHNPTAEAKYSSAKAAEASSSVAD